MGMCRPCRVFPFLHLFRSVFKESRAHFLPSAFLQRGELEREMGTFQDTLCAVGFKHRIWVTQEAVREQSAERCFIVTRMVTLGEFSLYSLSHLCSVTTSTEVMRIWGKLQGCTLVTVNKSLEERNRGTSLGSQEVSQISPITGVKNSMYFTIF